MSDKESKSVQNKGLNNVFKWSLIVLSALILEAAAILAAVKITESRGKTDVTKLQNILDRLSAQQKQISTLEKLPSSIYTVNQQLNANTQDLNILTENLKELNEKAGIKIAVIDEKIEQMKQRVGIIEESSRDDALILNLALIIKENILYQRSFTEEAELLSDISQNKTAIKPYVDIINNHKNQQVKNDIQLAQQYNSIAPFFVFSNEQETSEEPETSGAMAKGVKMLKGTVAKLNFDKVIVLKKNKPTKQQQDLIDKINNLVESYNYQEVLSFLADHSELKNSDEQEFELWKRDVSDKLEVENALSEIITKQLASLRQSIKNKTIQIPVATNENTEDDQTQSPVEEVAVEEGDNNENQAEVEETAND